MKNAEDSTKYQQFVDDFNSGVDRARLCAKYRLTQDKFDLLLEFLRRKGFVLRDSANQPQETAVMKCPKCGYERSLADTVVDSTQCPKCQIIYAKWAAPEEPHSSERISGAVRPVDVETLIYRNEPTLFTIHLALASVYWLALILVTKGGLLLFLPLYFLGYVFAQSALLAYLKGNGIKLSSTQFPELYNRHLLCCKKLGVTDIPDAYMINGNGFLNAFAARFLGRDFVVLYSNVIHGMAEQPDAINFYIGHELGHIKRNHLLWGPFLWPASLLPLVGAAYSRAREYTCDQFGSVCCENTESALKGLIALSAGEKLWSDVDIPAYLLQVEQSGGFWMSFHELISDYPWLVKRASRINNPFIAAPQRNAWAWLVAFFIPRVGVAGSAAGLLVTVAIIGILAAIAIPQFQHYKARGGNVQMQVPEVRDRQP